MNKIQASILSILILLGFSDSVFLTYEHYSLTNIGCPVSPWINCLAVTTSQYSEVFGIPLALLGVIYYLFLAIFLYKGKSSKMFIHFFLITSSFGVLFSIYLIFIQAILIKIFCLYCLLSAVISLLLFGFSAIFFEKEWKTVIVDSFGYGYKFILRPILWQIDATKVHEGRTYFGYILSKFKFFKNLFKLIFGKKYKNLKINLAGIHMDSPVGLAAGFDYNAQIIHITKDIGFGYQSVGTITNLPYNGNPMPQLGRLPKSYSLLVNKGFKNKGTDEIVKILSKNKKFNLPIGISLGRSNVNQTSTVEESIKDIVSSFKKLEKARIKNSYYELNISCPNIINSLSVNFYDSKSLDSLLKAVDKLKINKPILIKMPIDQGDRKTLNMLKVIAKHKVKGVIFGNLQTNKNHKSLVKSEVKKFKMGKFSGKPTFEASNALIKLTYKNFKDRFVIVGTGGIFNAGDAWVKFTYGASAVQLITAMVFEGPQLIAQINRDLSERLQKEGYKNISQIVGTAV